MSTRIADRAIDDLNEADAALAMLTRTFPKNSVIKLLASLVATTAGLDEPPPTELWKRLSANPQATIDMLSQSLMGMVIAAIHLSDKVGR